MQECSLNIYLYSLVEESQQYFLAKMMLIGDICQKPRFGISNMNRRVPVCELRGNRKVSRSILTDKNDYSGRERWRSVNCRWRTVEDSAGKQWRRRSGNCIRMQRKTRTEQFRPGSSIKVFESVFVACHYGLGSARFVHKGFALLNGYLGKDAVDELDHVASLAAADGVGELGLID